MSNETLNREEILKKAIEKAIGNGWLKPSNRTIKSVDIYYGDDSISVSPYFTKLYKGFWNENYLFGSTEQIVYNKDFAKALGFKLADLGAWCDEGKDPLDFIAKLL